MYELGNDIFVLTDKTTSGKGNSRILNSLPI